MLGFVSGTQGSSLSPQEAALSGSAAGMVTRAIISPLDVIKIRFQLQIERLSSQRPEAKYSGLFQATRCIYSEEGLSAFWKGHIPAQLLSISYSAIRFSSFQALTEVVHKTTPYDSQASGVFFVCSGLSACFATAVCHPLDILRTRFVAQGEPKVYRNLHHAVTTMYRTEGVQTFYRGLSPALIAEFPYSAMQFFFYNVFLNTFAQPPKDRTSGGSLTTLLCGSAAGMVSKTVTHPIDVIKKRLQVRGFEEARLQFGQVPSYRGLMHCVLRITKEEGVQGFYKGLQPSLLKAALSTGFTLFWFEFFSSALMNLKKKRGDAKGE